MRNPAGLGSLNQLLYLEIAGISRNANIYKLSITIIFTLEEEQPLLSSECQDDRHTVGGPARSATHGNEFIRNQKAKVKILL